MADRYWVGGSGNWSDAANHWAASSGGAPGAGNFPTTSDDVHFDANSNTSNAAYTVTIDTGGTGNRCRNLLFEAKPGDGLGGTITCSGPGTLIFTGSAVLLAGMTFSIGGAFQWNGSTACTYTSNGVVTFKLDMNGTGAGVLQLADDFATVIRLSGSASMFDANGYKVTFTGGTSYTISPLNYHDLEIVNTAVKTCVASLAGNVSIAGTFTVTGNSAVNRILIQSSVVGTARTITAAAVSLTNADFMDITGAGAATWSGTSLGDAGGNSGITFTTPVTRYWVATSGGNWSAASSWSTASGGASGASVPLCHDTVVFDANSITSSGRTIQMDMPRAGKDISLAEVLNSPTIGITSLEVALYGSLTLASAVSTLAGGSGGQWHFRARSDATFSCGGVSIAFLLHISMPAAILTLVGNLSSGRISLRNGTFDASGYEVSCPHFWDNGETGLKEVRLGGGTWTLTGDDASINRVWGMGSANGSVVHGGSTIKISNAGATKKSFVGGGLTYYNVWFNNAGAGTFDITGSNTFNQLKVDAGRTVRFTAATTTTAADFDFGAGCTIQSITSAAHTLAKTGGGSVLVSGATISYSTATPASTFFAESSTNGGNNSGWTFGPRIVAQPGTVTLTGHGANVAFNRAIVGLPGAIAVTGGEARFVWAGVLDGRYRFRVPARTQRFTVPARTIRFRSGGS